jgi:hypothetical protein
MGMRMDRKSHSAKSLAAALRDGTFGLPDFQRPSVWSAGQQRDLLESLMRGLSIGVITLWEVPANAPSKQQRPFYPDQAWRTHKYLVLDGQQRLRALAALCEGVDPYQRKPKHVVIDRLGALKLRKPVDLDQEPIGDFPTPLAARGRVSGRTSLSRKQRMVAHDVHEALTSDCITVVVVPLKRYEDAIDLFERINSRGQRLAVKDLIAARLAESYSEYITRCDEISRALAGDGEPHRFDCFDRMVLTKLVAFAATGNETSRAKDSHEIILNRLHSERGGFRKRNLQTKRYLNDVRRAAERLREELICNFGLGSRQTESVLDGSSATVAIQYLLTHKQPKQRDLTYFRRWLLLMLFSTRYTGGATESKVDEDLKAVSQRAVPWKLLFARACSRLQERGVVRKASPTTIRLQASPDFYGKNRNRRYLEVLRRFLIANQSLLGWIDRDRTCRAWEPKASLQHIFPRNPRNTRDFKRGVNLREHPANFATIESRDNSLINNRMPEEYLRGVSSDARRQQLIPGKQLWKSTRQMDFLDARTREIVRAAERKYRRSTWS